MAQGSAADIIEAATDTIRHMGNSVARAIVESIEWESTGGCGHSGHETDAVVLAKDGAYIGVTNSQGVANDLTLMVAKMDLRYVAHV